MAIAELLQSFIKPKIHFNSTDQEQAKKIAGRYLDKGNLWIMQKLRNYHCHTDFIACAIDSLPAEKQRAELLAAEKWYDFEHKDNKIKVIKLAQYLMTQHFAPDTAWEVARDFGNLA